MLLNEIISHGWRIERETKNPSSRLKRLNGHDTLPSGLPAWRIVRETNYGTVIS